MSDLGQLRANNTNLHARNKHQISSNLEDLGNFELAMQGKMYKHAPRIEIKCQSSSSMQCQLKCTNIKHISNLKNLVKFDRTIQAKIHKRIHNSNIIVIPSEIPPTLFLKDLGLRTYAALLNNKSKKRFFFD